MNWRETVYRAKLTTCNWTKFSLCACMRTLKRIRPERNVELHFNWKLFFFFVNLLNQLKKIMPFPTNIKEERHMLSHGPPFLHKYIVLTKKTWTAYPNPYSDHFYLYLYLLSSLSWVIPVQYSRCIEKQILCSYTGYIYSEYLPTSM